MNNWENHCLNDAVISSPYANNMSTPEAYYSPNQNQGELIQQNPTEYWYQQQQRGISPCSSGLSREESYSPCPTPMYTVEDTQLSSSLPSQYVPLIDPMVFGNNNNSGTASQAYQQPMMMPLLQHETVQVHHEKLLSHYNIQEAVMSDMNTYMSYTPRLSNLYSNNMYVSYQNGYTSQYNNNNHASTIDHSSINQQQYQHYQQHTNTAFAPQHCVKYAQPHESKHNSHHHLMTTTELKHTNASSPPSSSPSYSSSSSSNIINGTTSIIRHKQINDNNNNNNTQTSFPCLMPECNKLFSRPYNLKSHMRTHTLERPYECTYKPCAWKFARPHDLKRHELQHTGQKPHGCRFCHRRFARSDALKRHWKVDVNCAQALKQETALNGGNQVQMRRKKFKKTNNKQ